MRTILFSGLLLWMTPAFGQNSHALESELNAAPLEQFEPNFHRDHGRDDGHIEDHFGDRDDNVHRPPRPVPPPPPPHNEDEARRHEEYHRRLERARRAIARETVWAVGTDEWDCMRRAEYRINDISYQLIRRCEAQTEGLLSCGIQSRQTVHYPSPIQDIVEFAEYDKSHTTEDTCRLSAIQQAEARARSECQNKFDVACDVLARGTVYSHRVYKRRRYIIAGPKEVRHECKASAHAAPTGRYHTQCAIEAIARPYW